MSITPKVTVDEIELVNGSVGTPSLRFLNDLDTGFFLVADAQIGISVAGVKFGEINANELFLGNGAASKNLVLKEDTGIIYLDGTSRSKGIRFDSGASAIEFVGNSGVKVGSNHLYVNGNIMCASTRQFFAKADNDPTSCAFTFQTDLNTGIFWFAADELGLAAGGVGEVKISSAGLDILVSDLLIGSTIVIDSSRNLTNIANITSTGTLDFTGAKWKPERYEAAAEPTLADDEAAFWWDTNLTQMWLLTRRSGTQYKIQMT